MKILISACLLGIPCRYDGKAKPQPWAAALAQRADEVWRVFFGLGERIK